MSNNIVPSRQDWVFGFCGNSILEDKPRLKRQYINYMLMRTQRIFTYNGLPDTIPEKDLELLLQVTGSATITKVNDKLYAFYGGLGGELNEYYLPTISTVSNPFLNFSKNLKIDTECAVILNDSLYVGLMPMFDKYASLLCECDISIRMATINARIDDVLQADDDKTKASAEKFLNDIISGKFGVLASSNFIDESLLKIHSTASSNTIINELIELRNYIESSWYIDIGLNANYNMKRESLTDAETNVDDKTLLPLIQDMLERRRIGLEKVNALYGTNISVELSGVWKKMEQDVMTEPEENAVKDGDTGEIETNNE